MLAPGRLSIYALLAANGVSLLGNTLAAVAIPWFVLVTTGSPALTGAAAFFATAPIALGAFLGGAVADRIGLRRASILADVTSAVAVAKIPLLNAAGALRFWHLAVLAFVGSLFDAPGDAARQALLPELAARARMPLERANSLYGATEHGGYLLGAPLAGVLIASFGAPAALLVDTATFVASALLVAAAVPSVRAAGRRRPYASELAEGVAFVRRDPLLRTFLLVPALGMFLIGALAPVILPVYARTVLDSAAALGFSVAAYGAGGLCGVAAFALLVARLGRRTLYALSWAAYALVFAALVLLPPLALLLPVLFLVGLAAGALLPLENTVRQERTPLALRGRVLATVKGATAVALPPSVLVAGFLIESAGLRWTLAAFALGNVALAAGALVAPAARRLDQVRVADAL